MKRWTIGAIVVFGLLYVSAVQAITVDEVIDLSKSGADDSVILAQIQADSTVFHLTVQEILDLKDAGVSDPVITYMINTGKNAGVVAEVPQTEESQEPVVEENTDYTTSGGVAVGVSPGGVSLSVGFGWGYYYPAWPGYSWSWYCDPFYWPAWPTYYAYWAPWPYSYYAYSPYYYCRYGYSYGGYCGGYYGGYWGGYYPSPYYAYYGGRNVGNRGPVGGSYDRTIKNPSAPGAPERAYVRAQERVGQPRDAVHDLARLDTRPAVRSRAVAGTPSQGRGATPDVNVIRSQPTRERVSQTRPQPGNVEPSRPSARTSTRSTPPSRGTVAPPTQRGTSSSRSSARPPARSETQVQKPSQRGSKSAPAPSRSTVRSAPRSQPSPSRGSSARPAPRGGGSRGGGAPARGSSGRSSGGGGRH